MKNRISVVLAIMLSALLLCSGSSASGSGAVSFAPQTHRICAGASACAVLKDDGTVSCSLDTSEDQYIVVSDEWKSWKDIADISMNEEILVAAKSDGGVLWCGGRKKEYDWLNDPEYMGVIDSWDHVVQVDASCYDIAALKADGSIEITGSIWTEDLSEKTGFTQVSVYDALLCLREDGTVYCYAPAVYEGQTWEYDTGAWTDIIQVSAGFDHAVGLKKDGTVVATGCNEREQCEVESWTDIIRVCAGREHTLGLRKDGTVVYCGNAYDTSAVPDLHGWTDIVEISGFFDQFMGLKSDGTIVYTALYGRDNPAADSVR